MSGPDTVRFSVSEEIDDIDPAIARLLQSQASIDCLIAALDELIGQQVDAIVHHPDFQALESAWRALKFVVERVDFKEKIELALWNYSKAELQTDFEQNADVTKSWFYRTVYSDEYGQHGGKPYSAIFGNFSVTSSPDDLALLRSIASVAAQAHAPFFVDAAPSLLGVSAFEELPAVSDFKSIFDAPRMAAWNAFRKDEDSRYLGILLPRMSLRLPHRDTDDADDSAKSFIYNERIERTGDHLWGSATYAFAVRLADSHARYRSAMGLLGTQNDEPPVRDWHEAMNSDACKPSVDVELSRRVEVTLAAHGFISLMSDPVDGSLHFASANSLQQPKVFGSSEGGEQATLNYFLGTQIPYLLFVSSFAHSIKIIQREHLGGHHTPGELERDLTDWLLQFVNKAENPAPADRLRFPLRGAKVEVTELDGQPGWYPMSLFVLPHMRYKNAEFELSAQGRLDLR